MVAPSIFSFGSYFTSILSCLLLTLIGCHLLRIQRHAIYREIRLLVLLLVVSSVRLAIPINMPFSISIYSQKILPVLADWLFTDISNAGLMLYQCIGIAALLVSAVLLVVLIVRYSRYFKHFMIASKPSHELDELLSSIEPSASRLRIRYISADISPFIIGFARPLIIVPYGVYSDEELELVIRHEIIHYLEKDSQIKLLIELLTCLFWWNPLMYVIRSRINDALEISNDIRLSASLSEESKIKYAQCIVRTAKHTIRANDQFAIPFAHTENNCINVRIYNILDEDNNKKKKLSQNIRWALIIMPLLIVLSFAIIPEPWGVDPEAAATSFSLEYDLNMNPDNSFLIDQGDCYTLYIDGHKIGDLSHPDEEFENIRIFSTLEEASETMNITIKEDYDFNEK